MAARVRKTLSSRLETSHILVSKPQSCGVPDKYVGDARDFNNIQTRAVIKVFFPPRQGAE